MEIVNTIKAPTSFSSFKSQFPPFYLTFLRAPSFVAPKKTLKNQSATASQQISTDCTSTDCMQFPSSMSYIYYLFLLLSISIHWHKCAKVNNERPIRDGFWDSHFTRSFTTLSPNDPIFCHGEVQHHLDGFFLTVSIHDPTIRMAVFCLQFPPFKAVRILDLRSRAPQKDIYIYIRLYVLWISIVAFNPKDLSESSF